MRSFACLLNLFGIFINTLTTMLPRLPLLMTIPLSLTLNIVPCVVPSGPVRLISSSLLATPEPEHALHADSGRLPVPLHSLHRASTVTVPKNVPLASFIVPFPPHLLQLIVLVPGVAPEPLQARSEEH